MADSSASPQAGSLEPTPPKSKPINYNLRPAKNIERKMMVEAISRLSPIAPLSRYRYVGFGSEFFNDFALFHEAFGVAEMISIERDLDRIERCGFNRPYGCIKVEPGEAGVVLPTLKWNQLSIVWLDYTGRLNQGMLADLRFVVSQAAVGSILVWSFNADPWNFGDSDKEHDNQVSAGQLPERRLQKLKEHVGSTRVRSELKGSELGKWGLAKEFYSIVAAEIRATLNDRNAAASEEDTIDFHQCFHFRYRDNARMLTVGGLLLHKWAAQRLGNDPFEGLAFVRKGEEAFEIRPPMLTGREARYLSSRILNSNGDDSCPPWLSSEEHAEYRSIYRYYPIFAESEL